MEAQVKVKLWRYVVAPSEDGRDQGGVVVMGSDGYFSACSDYGNHAFRWSHTGEKDFRQFVLRCEQDPGYFITKFHYGVPRVWDRDLTLKGIQEYILDGRRELRMTAEEARHEWDLADSLILDEDFGSWYRATEIPDAYEFHMERDEWDIVNFVRRIMPRLCVLIRAEMKDECGPTETT